MCRDPDDLRGAEWTSAFGEAVSVKRCYGRPVLVEAMRRPWTVLGLYNRASARCPAPRGGPTAIWDPELVAALEWRRPS